VLVCTLPIWLKLPVQSLVDEISAAIDAAGGAISFEDFMARALYSPNGFYSTSGRAGRRGDFITSPEVGPLFGCVVARAIDTEWQRVGRPKKFTVLEVGTGPGTLARSILDAQFQCRSALDYIAVEVASAQRALHPSEIVSLAELPLDSFDGVVIANELLDNLAFRLFVFDGRWQEAFVTTQDGNFLEVLRSPQDLPYWLPETAAHGARVPVQDQVQKFLSNALGLIEHGALLVFDYFLTSHQAVSGSWRDWLRTYSRHQQGEHYLRQVGQQDITSHVMLDQVSLSSAPDHVSTQSDWLRKHGIDDLVEEGRQYWIANAAKPDLKAVKMRSRVAEAEALCDPAGLGSFKVLEWRR